MTTIGINDAELHYEEHGSGSRAIVFVHGFFSSSRIWRDSYLSRVPSAYRAYALDMRGHGQSRRATEGCNLVQLADDVYRWSQWMGLDRFDYVGVSMGGGVGVQLVLEHPEVLRSLVLMNTVTGLGPVAPRLAAALLPLLAGQRWLLKRMLRSGFTRTPPDETMRLLLDDALLVSRPTCEEWFHPSNRMRNLDRLHDVRVPTLVMIGGNDHVLPVDRQHRLADVLPAAEKVVFDEAGHMMVLEIPEMVLGAVGGFLERLLPGEATSGVWCDSPPPGPRRQRLSQ